MTACTTGIAHTYMAEEALKKQAAEMGVDIKVETNGASGVGNKLTAEDIKNAAGVIIAADKAVDMPASMANLWYLVQLQLESNNQKN